MVSRQAPLARHADGDLGSRQDLDEVDAGKLRALVGVEDVRPALPGARLLQRLDARQSALSVIDGRQARTLRLTQSTTAAR
jgi:hypothetical protein